MVTCSNWRCVEGSPRVTTPTVVSVRTRTEADSLELMLCEACARILARAVGVSGSRAFVAPGP